MLNKNSDKWVVVLAGPTAAGKTSVGIKLAKHFNTEIISADSRQCYRELRIGVARPSAAELESVPHHFIASHSIHDSVNAEMFMHYALEKANEILLKNQYCVLVGGTGLYIKAFTEGLDGMPTVPPAIRKQLQDEYEGKGIEWLQDEIRKSDPLFATQGEMFNPQRIMRALEITRLTGRSIFSYRTNQKAKRPFNIIKIGITPSKETLHRNIEIRVDDMIASGLEQEVASLEMYRSLPALQTVGYKEMFEYLDSRHTLTEAIESVKKNTRSYAKRQMTWFRKEVFPFFHPDDLDSILQRIGDDK